MQPSGFYHQQDWGYPTPNPSPQVEPRTGPIRNSGPLTRRQRAALQHEPSRPATPGQSPHHDQFAHSLADTTTPTYHSPLTPTSSTSSFSPYRASFFAAHSRSNSISTNPRSASPALSTISALTSISSHSVPKSFGSTTAAHSESERPKKQRLFNTQRREICEFHLSHPNARQEDIARQFGVERSTVSKILKNKTKWLNIDVNETLKIAKHRPSKFPEIEVDMVKWLLECRDNNVILSDAQIRNKAKEIALSLGVGEDRFKASSGWIENFKHRHGVKAGIWQGEGKNVRAARALGLGPPADAPPPILSQSDLIAFDNDATMEELEHVGLLPPPSSSARPPHIDEATDQPAWLSNPVEPPTTHPVRQSAQIETASETPSWLSQPADTQPLTTQQPLAPAWLPQSTDSIPSPHQHQHQPPPLVQRTLSDPGPSTVQYSPTVEMNDQGHVFEALYERAPQRPASLSEAEVALTTVINFFDTAGQNMVQPHERDVLATLKYTLFQATSSLPYDRTTIAYEQGQQVVR
ncbi:HTH CENPB-type domain-containing protein [Mycena indigotica]|uniref:HTH CENPB-type domain-containing protein n=1 Tax=Mycena indigotica TaxID=2126181 RepID=A0A8H6W153_9AGAR|nr:HTH CENPB-type domain-containing protein [Mycena indigotica]KAF7299191.1 HTH CENPB-type domain-containing protein [Mycena indigotica]